MNITHGKINKPIKIEKIDFNFIERGNKIVIDNNKIVIMKEYISDKEGIIEYYRDKILQLFQQKCFYQLP